MENKPYVIFIEGEQAYDTFLGIDYPLLDKLKQFFAEEGVIVQDMLFTEKTQEEKISEANTMLDNMRDNQHRLKLMIYFMK